MTIFVDAAFPLTGAEAGFRIDVLTSAPLDITRALDGRGGGIGNVLGGGLVSKLRSFTIRRSFNVFTDLELEVKVFTPFATMFALGCVLARCIVRPIESLLTIDAFFFPVAEFQKAPAYFEFKKKRMFQVFAILFPVHIDFRTLLRLAATTHEARMLLNDALTYMACHHCRIVWKRLRQAPTGPVAMLDRHRVARLSFVEASSVSRSGVFWLKSSSDYFVAHPPTADAAFRQMKTSLCRECFCPTRALAQTSSGRAVLLCRECSKDPDSYSCLVDYTLASRCSETVDGFRLKNAAVQRVLTALCVARRGGNRAKLYWKHEVVQALECYQERRAKATAK